MLYLFYLFAILIISILLMLLISVHCILYISLTFPMLPTEGSSSGAVRTSFKILSYNVWFREDLEVHKRMKSIGDLIQLHSPDIICFQVLL